ncbi:MAG: DUF1156 domain-containing protein, partial [Candidatus Hodarchaeota archaeon]
MQKERAIAEEFFPLEEVGTGCSKERIHPRKGSLTTLHVWWSRKPRVAARAIIYSVLIPVTNQFPEKEILTDLKKMSGWNWEQSDDREHIKKIRHRIQLLYGKEKPKVLDLFAGGGSIPFEAL